jgi:hypothetical protein
METGPRVGLAHLPLRRTFGSTQHLLSGRRQASYKRPEGCRRTAPHTFEEAADANAWLSSVEGGISSGDWRPPELTQENFVSYGERGSPIGPLCVHEPRSFTRTSGGSGFELSWCSASERCRSLTIRGGGRIPPVRLITVLHRAVLAARDPGDVLDRDPGLVHVPDPFLLLVRDRPHAAISDRRAKRSPIRLVLR